VTANARRSLGVTTLAAGLALALCVAGVVVGRRATTSVGPNTLVNPAGTITANNSPSLVRDPRNPARLVVTHRIDRPGFSALLDWSADGGRTWRPTALRLPPGTTPCAASPDRVACPFGPDAAFGPDGSLYVVYASLEGGGNTPGALWLARSSDGGRTLDPPVAVTGKLAFQARLAVDRSGTVYVVWLAADAVGLNRLSGPARVVASRSSDRGRTFSAPVPVSDAGRELVGAASPVIDSKGDLVVLYEDFKRDRRDFEGLEGPVAEEPFGLVVSRSPDGGRTFLPGVELDSDVVPTKRFLVFLPEYPSLAAGPSGELFVAWTDGRNGDEDVLLRRSDDGGGSWSKAVRVNDNRMSDGTAQYLPRLAVAPSGRVDVLFYDRRADPGNVMTNVFLASSGNHGRSFVNRRVSSTSFDDRVGPSLGPDYGTDFGTRLGLSSDDRRALTAWTDTRLGNQDTGRQDVFFAGVDVGSSRARRERAALLLAALLVVGATGRWLVRGRSVAQPGTTSLDAA